MNQKVRHLGKGKTDSLARKRPRKLHTLEYTNSHFKKKLLFIQMKIQLITISSAFPYISGMNSTISSLKKIRNLEKEKGGGKEKKRECEQEGKGEGKGEERRERE